MKPAIVLDDVRKSFGRKSVLKGVSGHIEPGKVVGLLGRNGEGKTTLFRIMLDIIAADSAQIMILHRRPDGTGKLREIVGYIPEKPGFHDFMSVEDVFRLRAGFFPTWNWAKANDMAKKLELDLGTRIQGASKGTLAKTAWICATAHNPAVLLLDEPTSGLDAVIRDLVLSNFVREMTEEGKTILVTNHHMEELLGVLDEVWILAGGVIRGRYSIDDLRLSAHHVTGRLRNPSLVAPMNGVVEHQRIGDLVRWMVLNKETLREIQTQDLLENLEVEAVPLETTFKVLLSNTVEPPC